MTPPLHMRVISTPQILLKDLLLVLWKSNQRQAAPAAGEAVPDQHTINAVNSVVSDIQRPADGGTIIWPVAMPCHALVSPSLAAGGMWCFCRMRRTSSPAPDV